MIQTSFGGLSSSNIALQAQQYASAKADIVKATAYDDLETQPKSEINNSNGFQDAVELSPEENYSDDIKQRTATIRIFLGEEVEPRYSLKVLRLSKEVKPAGVPVGTVIAWPASRMPDDGTWLLCNGQSCSAYPELVKVLGKSTVPNYQGIFLRGYGNQISTHYGNVTHSSAALGDLQGDAIRNITGYFGGNARPNKGSGAFFLHAYGEQGNKTSGDGATFGFNASRVVPVADENRPVNRAVNWLIKAA